MEQTTVKKETLIEWLMTQLYKKGFIKEVDGSEPINLMNQAKAMEKEQKIAFGKKCFYKGFEKAENDDANCFTAWREEANELLTFKSE